MELTNQFIFFSGLLLSLSILAGVFSHRIGAPLLLVFLGVGVLFGEDGPGGIVFNDMPLSYTVCSLALAIILLDGGLHTPFRNFRVALRPSFLLSTVGVLLTTGVTAAGAHLILGIDLLQSLLFGSIVASTDAAAVFLLLRQRGVKIRPLMSNTLEVESGINDPMAIFLTLTFVTMLSNPVAGNLAADAVIGFVQQMGIGAFMAYLGGKVLIWLLDRIEMDSGLYPIIALSGGLLVFGATNMMGGSGFLAIYGTGLILGNHEFKAKKVVQQFLDGLAWLSQLAMLLVLGLLVTPTKLVDDIPTALVIAGMLLFVSRPLAVFACLLFEPFNWREKLFMSWVGLRGAIPIYLAIIPVMMGVEGQYFNIAFIVVLCSLFLQGWSIQKAAKLLKVETG